MKTYTTMCDMGCIKIYNHTMSVFFHNAVGDGDNIVNITDGKSEKKNKAGKDEFEFLGHFTVKTNAYLSQSDCDEIKIHRFGPGRYFVELNRRRGNEFNIWKHDDDLHA